MRKLVMSSLQDEQINDDEQGKSFSANCCQKAGMSKKFLRSTIAFSYHGRQLPRVRYCVSLARIFSLSTRHEI